MTIASFEKKKKNFILTGVKKCKKLLRNWKRFRFLINSSFLTDFFPWNLKTFFFALMITVNLLFFFLHTTYEFKYPTADL